MNVCHNLNPYVAQPCEFLERWFLETQKQCVLVVSQLRKIKTNIVLVPSLIAKMEYLLKFPIF